jgi:hypothetical protein
MKLVFGHTMAFLMMFVFCYVGLASLILFLPLLSAFVAWDWSELAFGWSTTFLWMRVMALLSAFVGIAFTLSAEGKYIAHDFAKGL